MGKNSMHEAVYSPTDHEVFLGEIIMPGAKFSF